MSAMSAVHVVNTDMSVVHVPQASQFVSIAHVVDTDISIVHVLQASGKRFSSGET